jgi:hypothetical protein
MGCDIHFFVEVKQQDGTWKSADEWETEYGYTYVTWGKQFYRGRNYDLFAILADVRNGRGFAGIKTGEGFNPIAEPKGLPEDASPEVAANSEDWDVDGHSHSWFTFAELRAFDWQQESRHQGWVGIEEFKEYAKTGKPSSWCGGVGGTSVVLVTIDQMMEFVNGNVAMQDGKSYYTLVSWTETYAESVGSFLTETLPKMEALGAPDEVRAVFWFDN